MNFRYVPPITHFRYPVSEIMAAMLRWAKSGDIGKPELFRAEWVEGGSVGSDG